ncbi:MAG: CDP-alcohol phosphatidyltransferase family protein [Deltaproteobacteria bacterium]|nr:CDP-alcohol phosphatidyltransferase family protein [Deltaproteobacteria bacterium]MBI4374131.1 CDP-alcohol phosphatidyltransferase family protein [Deltaproteobacteria bacterium]
MIQYLSQINPVWISLAPLIAVNILFLFTLGAFAAVRKRRPRHEDVDRKEYSRFLPKFLVEYWYWLLEPVERGLVRLGISPDALTLSGLAISAIAGYLFHQGMVAGGGWFMIFGATFDMLDGRVARLTNRESRSGAFFDSVIDRFAEAVLFLGLAGWYRNSWVLYFVVIALIGSMMVSYTRARGEGVGIKVTKGMMQRPERIVYLGVGSIFSPILAYLISFFWDVPYDLMTIIALVIIAVFTVIGAIYRIQYVLIQLDPEPQSKRLFRRFVQRWLM